MQKLKSYTNLERNEILHIRHDNRKSIEIRHLVNELMN